MIVDLLRVIEACYASVADDAAWLAGVLDALGSLDHGVGMCAQLLMPQPGGAGCVVEALATTPAFARARWDRASWCAAVGAMRVAWAAGTAVGYAIRDAARLGDTPAIQALLAGGPVADLLGIVAADATRSAVVVAAPLPGGVRPHAPRTLHQLKVFAPHLAAGLRLRRYAVTGATSACAVTGPPSTATLAQSVRHRIGSRSAPRAAPEEARQLWNGVMSGAWSLVGQGEADGKRLVLVRRNAGGALDPKALTAPERGVVALAAMGYQNKLIAYQRGLSTSAVAAHLRSAQRKLGLTSRAELIRVLAPFAGGEGC